jgi:hypothetical protein
VGPDTPEPLSLAVQGTMTSLACQTAAGGVQVRIGGVRSTLKVKTGVELLTFGPLLVTTVSTTFELSFAA